MSCVYFVHYDATCWWLYHYTRIHSIITRDYLLPLIIQHTMSVASCCWVLHPSPEQWFDKLPDETLHTTLSKHCFVFILWIVNVSFFTIVKTLFFNVVLQCLLIYYGYYIWIYLMTQDTMVFFCLFQPFFFFFFFTYLWLFRLLPLKKEITTEHISLVELNPNLQLK